MARIQISDLVKRYGKAEVIHAINLDIADGEFVVLVGPSGCGKSTTLRMVAGLEDISGGEVRIGDQVVNNMPPKDRNIAMVFQNYAIYPHLTLRKNIAFGLHTAKLTQGEKDKKVEEVAELLGLTPYLERRPAALSGGQRQRVAIGRAMVRDPQAFLFDEPLSNLDAQLRAQMRIEIKELHNRLGTTIVYVTHDQVEAMTMADRIVVMRDGHILQTGTPMEIYDHPKDVFTARFIGTPSMNILTTAEQNGTFIPEAHGAITVGIRPQQLFVNGTGPAAFKATGTVTVVETLGPETLVHFRPNGSAAALIATAAAHDIPTVGATVTAQAAPGALHLFDTTTQLSLGRR